MLLPSLLPCDGTGRSLAPTRTFINPSNEPSLTARTDEPLTSCRALQAILGSSGCGVSINRNKIQRPRLRRFSPQSEWNNQYTLAPAKPVGNTTSSLCSPRKHRLDESEELLCHRQRTLSNASTLISTSPELGAQQFYPLIVSPLHDQESFPTLTPSALVEPAEESSITPTRNPDASDGYSTPKRRRLVPLEIPFGLTASDFESINMPPGYGPEPSSSEEHLETTEQQTQTQIERTRGESNDDPFWTPSDDVALVNLLLTKLHLTKREWNECARILGKDKDSMGRRWRYLVGNGEVGLRRGSNDFKVRRSSLNCLLREADGSNSTNTIMARAMN